MPQTEAEWAWFFFWGIGALGGWLILGILAVEAWKSFKKMRPR